MNSDLLKKPEHSLAELVCQYSQVLCELLDKHAPLKTRTLTVRPEAPWMEDSIFSARKERRRLERRWRLSRLTIDREILQKQIQRVKRMLLTARSTYYADKSTSRLVTQERCSILSDPCYIRIISLHCQITTTLSCCLTVSAITSKIRSPLSDVTLIVTRHSPHCACVRLVPLHTYQRSSRSLQVR